LPASADPAYSACTPTEELKGVAQVWSFGGNPSARLNGLLLLGGGLVAAALVGFVYEKSSGKGAST
jgi:hypothetical protein